MNRSLFLGSLLAFAAASTYGLSYVTARWAYDEGTDAQTINGLRLAALALFNAVWVSASGAKFTVSWYAFFGSVWTGFFMFVGGAGNLGAIQYIPVSLAILVFYTYPLQTLLFASVLDRRWPRRTDYLAILLSLAGLALALDVSLHTLNATGILLALVGASGAAAHLVAAQKVQRIADYKVVTMHMGLSGFLFSGVLIGMTGGPSIPTGAVGLGLLGLVLLGFTLGMTAMMAAVRFIGPVRTSIIMCLEPPVVILFAFLVLGEKLEAVQILGAAMVVAGVMLAQAAPARTAADR